MPFGGPGGPGNFGETMGGNLPGGGGGGWGDVPSQGASHSLGGLRGGGGGGMDAIAAHFNLQGLPAGIGPGQSQFAGVADQINNALRSFFSALGLEIPHRDAVDTGSPGIAPNRYGGQITTQQGYMDSVAPNFSAGYMGTVGASDPRSPYSQAYHAAHREGLINSLAQQEQAQAAMEQQIGAMIEEGNLTPSMRDQLQTAATTGDLATMGQFGLNTSAMEGAFGAKPGENVTTADERMMKAMDEGFVNVDDEGKVNTTVKGKLAPLSGPLKAMGVPLGMAAMPGLSGVLAGLALKGAGKQLSGSGGPALAGFAGPFGTGLDYGADMQTIGNALAAAGQLPESAGTGARGGGSQEGPLSSFLAQLMGLPNMQNAVVG